jgi:hypothetical protein
VVIPSCSKFQSIKNIRDSWLLETRCMDNFVQMRKGNVSLPLWQTK